jgi:predicted metal-dependent HD superfamily phosphohydrolase
MPLATSERWTTLMAAFGLAPNLEMFAEVCAAYFEGHRRYHTTEHLEACLSEFEVVRSLARSESEVEAALWFHDVVYDPRSSNNERRSADMAAGFLASAGATQEAVAHVHSHVLATAHASEPEDPDSRLVVDVDLSILGQGRDVYDRFEQNVRDEYRWVPFFVYRRKRTEILQSFLDRRHLYATEWFRSRYEAAARENLQRTIEALRK